MNEGTIIANSSASGTAAISLLRLSGENAIDLVTSSFKSKSGKKLSDQKSHAIHLGRIHNDGTEIDEVLVSVFKAPNSYTGENVVEISCHGSIYIQQEILHIEAFDKVDVVYGFAEPFKEAWEETIGAAQ